MQVGNTMREEFECKIRELLGDKSDRSLLMSDDRRNELVEEIKSSRDKGKNGIPLSAKDYRHLKLFDVICIGDSEKKYSNITREVINVYLNPCELCTLKKKVKGKVFVVKPMVMFELNSPCQVDLIDMKSEPDGDYKFIQDHLTKFVVLRPLKMKTADELAYIILDIVCLLGAPNILHSDNGREFCDKMRRWELWWLNGMELILLIENCATPKAKDPSNERIKTSETTKILQVGSVVFELFKAQEIPVTILELREPLYEALFGVPQRNGLLDSCLPSDIAGNIDTEEQLEEYLSI
ncbi:hypothetical protein PR048_004339 [Dryococelus australis]|uniref:Integrase catalytic domain-containing protein n=1 Tax=Dryococelus australis TaxID=614101 RepID=A0ABQ9I606_9NEOP|nr:hypothetical protein PR048_004339 [Dryococelus australis]